MQRYIWLFVVVFWGCSTDHFPDAPKDDPPAAKPAVKFVPNAGTNYDPYKERDWEGRKSALGGNVGVDKYYRIIVAQVAQALQDEQAREIIHNNTPEWEKGEVRISKLAIAHPHLLKMLSANFIQSVSDKEIDGDLASTIHEDLFDGEALLQVLGAIYDLEITLVNKWDGSKPIAVLYIPADEEASVTSGLDAELNPISWRAEDGIPTYPFLSVHVDEDTDGGSLTSLAPTKDKNVWSLTTPAHAHYPSDHPSCYDHNIIRPLVEIEIYDNHEKWDWEKPEIELELYWYNNSIDIDRFELTDLDVVDSVYTDWELSEVHGTCNQDWDKLQVWEADVTSSDDNVAFWRDIRLYRGGYQTLKRADADSEEKDAQVKIIETNED